MLSYDKFKRGFDLVASILGLVLLSPFLLIIAIAIKIDSSGPVFFRQKRTGKDGKEFEILKFRSMVKTNNVNDLSRKDKNTRLGVKLRKTSIDELPQLVNVIKGEMALVGPRPWVPEYFENMNDKERKRYSVRPGITGLAVVKGRRTLDVFQRIKYDLEYVRKRSFLLDAKILLLTACHVFYRDDEDDPETGKEKIHKDIEALKEENHREFKVDKDGA